MYMIISSFLKLLIIQRTSHGFTGFFGLRRLANVEMFSVTSCVARRRCHCDFFVLNFKAYIIFVSDTEKFD